MEPVFENRYTRNNEMYKEINLKLLVLDPKIIVLSVIFLISFIANIILLFTEKTFSYTPIIVSVFFFVLIFTRYRKSVSVAIKRSEETLGGSPEVTATFLDDGFLYGLADKEQRNISYSNIKKVQQTKNYIMLISEAKLMYIVSKDGFTKGSPDELVDFLKSKGFKM